MQVMIAMMPNMPLDMRSHMIQAMQQQLNQHRQQSVVVGPARREQQPRVSAAAVAETLREPQPTVAQPAAAAAPDLTAAVAQGLLAPLDDGPMCVCVCVLPSLA